MFAIFLTFQTLAKNQLIITVNTVRRTKLFFIFVKYQMFNNLVFKRVSELWKNVVSLDQMCF